MYISGLINVNLLAAMYLSFLLLIYVMGLIGFDLLDAGKQRQISANAMLYLGRKF